MPDHGSATMRAVRDDNDVIVEWVAECSGGETFHGASLDEVDRSWCAHVNQVIPGANEQPMSKKRCQRVPVEGDPPVPA